jgi:hypothetical protein
VFTNGDEVLILGADDEIVVGARVVMLEKLEILLEAADDGPVVSGIEIEIGADVLRFEELVGTETVTTAVLLIVVVILVFTTEVVVVSLVVMIIAVVFGKTVVVEFGEPVGVEVALEDIGVVVFGNNVDDVLGGNKLLPLSGWPVWVNGGVVYTIELDELVYELGKPLEAVVVFEILMRVEDGAEVKVVFEKGRELVLEVALDVVLFEGAEVGTELEVVFVKEAELVLGDELDVVFETNGVEVGIELGVVLVKVAVVLLGDELDVVFEMRDVEVVFVKGIEVLLGDELDVVFEMRDVEVVFVKGTELVLGDGLDVVFRILMGVEVGAKLEETLVIGIDVVFGNDVDEVPGGVRLLPLSGWPV